MTTLLLILAVLAITTGRVPAAILAGEGSPALLQRQGEVAVAALAGPQSDRVDVAPGRCPYHFDSDMPAATFCVYRGVAFGSSGAVCAADVVAIWSSFDAHAPRPVGSGREVYLAFVADPGLVLRASVDSRQSDRAEVVGYTLDSEAAPQPLAGQMSLRAMRLGASGMADVLSMDLRGARPFHPGSCAFASYSGMFLGVIRPASDPEASIDPVR